MHLLNVHYPAVEYPNFRYDDDTHKIITMPLKQFSKNAPEISEIRLKSGGNQAVVESLQKYMSSSDDVIKYSKKKKKFTEDDFQKRERFETTREQSNTILFLFLYCYGIVILMLMWYYLFR